MFKRLRKIVSGLYRDIFKYIYFEPFGLKPLKNNSDDWFNKYKIIPHAMGGINEDTYTNSLEAFEQSVKNGFNTMEIDVCMTKDHIPVLCHNDVSELTFQDFMTSKIDNKYTPMSLEMLINAMKNNSELIAILDIKNKQEVEVTKYLKSNATDIIDRFVIQIPSVKAFKDITKIHRFKYFHYNFSVDGNVNYHLGFVVKNNIPTCSVAIKSIKNAKTLRYLNKYGVKVFSYTVNTQELYDNLKEKGCYGIITDSPNNIK